MSLKLVILARANLVRKASSKLKAKKAKRAKTKIKAKGRKPASKSKGRARRQYRKAG